MKAKQTIKLSEIIFDEKIYPRKEHNNAKVQEYADSIERIEGAGVLDVVLLRVIARSLLLELRNVGPRDERDVSFSAQYDYPDAIVSVQFASEFRNRSPHFCGDGIATLRMIEDDFGERSVTIYTNLSRHGASIAKPNLGSETC